MVYKTRKRKIGAPANPGRIAPQLNLGISQGDIDKGCMGDGGMCMIARSVMRAFPGAQYLRCDRREIAFSDPATHTRRRYFNTPAGANAVWLFDQGRKDEIKPFRLNLHDGVVIPMGWQAKHPGSDRRNKIYKKTGKKAMRFTRRRSYGACNITGTEAEVAASTL